MVDPVKIIIGNILLNGDAITEVEWVKCLGVNMDQRLDWNLHTDLVINRITLGIYAHSRLSKICDLPTLKSVYHVFVHSFLIMAIHYGEISEQNRERVFLIQKN